MYIPCIIVKIIIETGISGEKDYNNNRGTGEPVLREESNVASLI